MAMTHTRAKMKVKGQFVQKNCKQTDGHDRLQYIRSNTITCISFGVTHKSSDYLSDLETLRIQKCLRPVTW